MRNIGNTTFSIADKCTDVTDAMDQYKDTVSSCTNILSDYNKSNDEWLAECDKKVNSNKYDEKVNSYNKNDNDIDRLINSSRKSSAERLKRIYERDEAEDRRREQRRKESDRLFYEYMKKKK